MAKDNLKDLYKRYLEIQAGKPSNMADGGEVKSDDSILSDLADKLKKAFSSPTAPIKSHEDSLDEKYSKIREQNHKNFNDSSNNPSDQYYKPNMPKYSSGGQVQHNSKNIHELKAAFDKFLNEEAKEKMSEGGVVNNFVPEGDIQHYDTGGEVHPSIQSIKKLYPGISDEQAQQIANSSIDTQQPVQKAPMAQPQYMNSVGRPSPADSGSLAQNTQDQINQMSMGAPMPAMADGGEVQDPVYPDLTPEEIQSRQAELEQLKAQGAQQIPVQGEEQSIAGSSPSKESEVEESEDPEDKSTEQKMANEDFKAEEKSDDDSDDESEESANPRSLAQNEKSPEKDQAAGLQVSPDVKKMVENSHLSGNDLKEAQAQRDQNLALNQLQQGAALFGAGVSRTDPSQVLGMLKEQQKLAGLPVQKYSELVANQQNDPNSQMSQVVKQYMSSKGLKIPENASAADLFKVAPFLAKDSALQNAIQKVIMQQKGAGERNAASNKTKEDSIEAANKRAEEARKLREKELVDKKENTKIAKETKASNDQNRALQSTQQLLESARGNPAASQAEKDLYSVQKVNSLFNSYPDLNSIPDSQVNLAISEIAKIAQGGVPTGHEMDALKPNTPESRLQKLWGQLENSPKPANLGQYLKELKKYNDSLAKDAQQVIKDKYGRVIETRKKQLGDDNYKSLTDQYLNRFTPVTKEIPVDADLSKMSPSELKSYIKLHGG